MFLCQVTFRLDAQVCHFSRNTSDRCERNLWVFNAISSAANVFINHYITAPRVRAMDRGGDPIGDSVESEPITDTGWTLDNTVCF